MCACASTTATSSTTWAASVPADLTDTIAAAVGVQPVRTQAPLRLTVLEQQQAASPSQAASASTGTVGSGPSWIASAQLRSDGADIPIRGVTTDISTRTSCSVASPCGSRSANAQAAVPNRRPTLVEVRAASPPTDSELEQFCCSSNAVGHDGQQRPASCSSPVSSSSSSSSSPPLSTPVFDDMDDLQLQNDVAHSRSSSFSESDLEASVADAADVEQHYFQPPSSKQEWHTLCDKHTHEQQRLLCQLWSTVHTQPDLHLQQFDDAASPPQADGKASSCCSEESVQTMPWPAARSSFESSGYCSTELQSSPSSSTYSRASSVCSSRTDKRVTWGTVTEYQLPPEPQCSWVSAVVPQWVQGRSTWISEHASGGCSRAEAAVVGAAAAGLVIAVAGAAALAYTRRSASA